MINDNGQYTKLDRDGSLELARDWLVTAGFSIATGSVEEQMQFALAAAAEKYDVEQYKNYQKYLTPTASDIDLLATGVPRYEAKKASGYVRLKNETKAAVTVAAESTLTAATGAKFKTEKKAITIAAGASDYLAITADQAGLDGNVIKDVEFSSDYELKITNPQPITNGRNKETDLEYRTRMTERTANISLPISTTVILQNLKKHYADARLYINNQSTAIGTPVPIPANGYSAIILTESGVTAEGRELAAAFNELSLGLQFLNSEQKSTKTHKILSGTVYSANTPLEYRVGIAQSVEFILVANIDVSFYRQASELEKEDLSSEFGRRFLQNLIDLFGGTGKKINIKYQSIASGATNKNKEIELKPSVGKLAKIAPSFSLEQIRALILDASGIGPAGRIKYEAVQKLQVKLDSELAGESVKTLDSSDAHTPDSVDFSRTVKFSDNTSWYDRYMFLDPAKLSVTIREVDYSQGMI